MMQLIKKFQCISLIVFMTGFVFFTSPVCAQDLFNEYQSILTQEIIDWESFTIGSDTFLAVANNTDSKIYKWNGRTGFVEYQSIETLRAADWEYFTIGTDPSRLMHFLAVANVDDVPPSGPTPESTSNVDSKIYKWNGDSFEEYQSIPTHGASDWESFTIGSDTYLAVANACNDVTWNIDSKIYRWDGDSFEEYQSISTQGAGDWEYFTIGSDTYLAVANEYNDSTSNIDSKIYKWNGSAFVEYQSIPTHGACDWESFTIGSDTFLALANWYDGESYNLHSKIYKWDWEGSADGGAFVEIQSIPTHGACDWESFTIGSATFLAVANWGSVTTHNVDSKIYRSAPYAVRVPSEQAPTIRAAIDLVADGGTVSIEPGVYEIQEPITIHGKTVNIEGAGSSRNPKPGKLTQLVAPPPTEVADPEVATGIFNFIGAGGVIKDMDMSGGDAGIVGRSDYVVPVDLQVQDVNISNTGRGILWKFPV